MKSKEENIRQAAAKLADTIAEGRDAGLVVAWPVDAAGLRAISISEIAKAPEAETKTASIK